MGKFVCMASFGEFETIVPSIFNSGSRRS